ncbi:MAG: hypothetical protein KAJ67_04105, partial [Gemmatimonadetes bacterium]|nr:hypothetical protein [Gemmatimonadota bacterium]
MSPVRETTTAGFLGDLPEERTGVIHMKLPNRLSALAITLPLFVGCASGDSGPTGPGGDEVVVVWALNSIGQTIRTFEIGEGISPLGLDVVLEGLFDGVAMDVAFPLAVT